MGDGTEIRQYPELGLILVNLWSILNLLSDRLIWELITDFNF